MSLTKIYIKNCLKLGYEKLFRFTGRGKKFLPEKRFWEMMCKNFPAGTNFHFIQVGANDGVSFDILYDIVKERRSKGIVIEPLPDFYKKLCINYKFFPHIVKVNIAAHPTLSTVTMYRVDPVTDCSLASWTSGIASLDPMHHKKSGTESKYIIEERVKALPLMQIIAEAKTGVDVDLLQIDVEGFDYEILNMIDFNRMKPSAIKYEYSNLSAIDFEKSKELLTNNGYHLFPIGDDMIAILLRKIRL